MHISDGENRDYLKTSDNKTYYAWGWLDSNKEYTKGWTSEKEKLKFLLLLKELPITDFYRGSHIDPGFNLSFKSGSNGSIKFTFKDVTYVAPAAVSHYIENFDYCPPMQVLITLDEYLKTTKG